MGACLRSLLFFDDFYLGVIVGFNLGWSCMTRRPAFDALILVKIGWINDMYRSKVVTCWFNSCLFGDVVKIRVLGADYVSNG